MLSFPYCVFDVDLLPLTSPSAVCSRTCMAYVTRTHFCAAEMVRQLCSHTHLQPPETISHLPLRRHPPSPSLMHLPSPDGPLPSQPPAHSLLCSFLLSWLSHLLHRGFRLCLSGWLSVSQMTNPKGSPAPCPPQAPRPGQHGPPKMEGSAGPHPIRSCSISSIFSARAITLLMLSFSSSVSSSCVLCLSG